MTSLPLHVDKLTVNAFMSTPKRYGYGLDNIGGRIRWAIDVKLGIKHHEFAARLGVVKQQVSRWVNDPKGQPNLENLQRIASETGVPVGWLRDGDEDPWEGKPSHQTLSGSPTVNPGRDRDSRWGTPQSLIKLFAEEEVLRELVSELGPVGLRIIVGEIAGKRGWSSEEGALVLRAISLGQSGAAHSNEAG